MIDNGKREATELITRAAFSRLVDVHRSRVGQWIKEDKIRGKAITGKGRKLRLDPDMARRQLVKNLDVAQRFGNGIGTQLADAPPPGKPSSDGSSASLSIEDRIRWEKLTEYEARNRRMKEQERERAGIYMRTDDARAQMAKIAAVCLRVMEGGLVDLAAAVATRFEISNRDVLHLMRREFREIRTRAHKSFIDDLADMAEFVDDDDAVDPPPLVSASSAGAGAGRSRT